jgi:hypothetical protein
MTRTINRCKAAVLVTAALVLLAGCGGTNVERKTTGGIGLGALAGGLMSGDAKGAVAGAAVGGLAGYAIGTDQDRYADKQALEQERLALEKEQTAIAKATITNDPKTAYRPESRNDLVGTTWRVISIEGEQPFPEYHSLVTTFQTNSTLTTLVIGDDGKAETVAETYQLVEDVMVVSGEEGGQKYVVDGKFSVKNDTFIYVTPTYRVVAEKVD